MITSFSDTSLHHLALILHILMQVRVNPARPPCSYLGQGGMVEGHAGLTNGDCDETLGRDMDIEGVCVCVFLSPSPVH